MTEDEKRIIGFQEHLDLIANKIDQITVEDEDDEDNEALCYRLIHAQGSALLYLLKKGQTDLEYKNIEEKYG
jgi:hypothetical protein